MELIVKDSRNNREWYYEDGKYIAKTGDVAYVKLYGKHLPDPDLIRERRKIAQKMQPVNMQGLYRVEPDPITVALWNDWQNRKQES